MSIEMHQEKSPLPSTFDDELDEHPLESKAF